MQINANLNLRVIKQLKSEGVNSNLYLVEDNQIGSELILKQIKKSSFKNPEIYFEESRKIYNSNHPNIVKIVHASMDEDYIYITMPYYKNGSLHQLMDHENLSIREIIKYSLDFLSAVYYLHLNKIIHCDIKPNNILISDDKKAVITDFGSASYVNDNGLARIRNVYYKHIAPEQSSHQTVDNKVDIYQIGTTLYRLCNGNNEYNRQIKKYKDLNMLKLAIARGNFPKRRKYPPHIPIELSRIIEKCLNVNPDERYEDVLAIMNDLSYINKNLDIRYQEINNLNYLWYIEDKYEKTKIILNKEDGKWNIRTAQIDKIMKSEKLIDKGCFKKIEEKKYAHKLVKKTMALLHSD